MDKIHAIKKTSDENDAAQKQSFSDVKDMLEKALCAETQRLIIDKILKGAISDQRIDAIVKKEVQKVVDAELPANLIAELQKEQEALQEAWRDWQNEETRVKNSKLKNGNSRLFAPLKANGQLLSPDSDFPSTLEGVRNLKPHQVKKLTEEFGLPTGTDRANTAYLLQFIGVANTAGS